MTDKLTKQDISEIQSLIFRVEETRTAVKMCNNSYVFFSLVMDDKSGTGRGNTIHITPSRDLIKLWLDIQLKSMINTLNEKYGVEI